MAALVLPAADWPQIRGANRDGVYADQTTVAAFPDDGPEVVWERPVGAGFAGPVVANGRVILFHRLGGSDVVEALDADDGKPVWKYEYTTTYEDSFGFDEGPRASPVVWGGQIYTFGAQGALHCLEFATGRKIWSIATNERFGVSKGFFGASSAPLVLGSRLFANIGGTDGAGIVAFDKDTGRVLWQATDHEASYSAPIAARWGDETLVVFFTREGLVALEPSTGDIRYERHWRSRSRASVNAATPIVSGETIFLSASYGTGSIALKVGREGLTELWSGEDVIDSHYSTPVLRDGVLYGYHGRQEYGQSFRAAELATGKVLWSEDGFGAGTVTAVGDRLLLLRESGELALIEPSRDQFKVIAQARILLTGVRAYPAISEGRLYARDQNTLVAIEVGP